MVDALATQGAEVSRARVARAFADGEVVDADTGARLKPSQRLDAALRVRLSIPHPPALHAQPEALPLSVLFEDEHVLVVDKPAHMAVHPGPGHPGGTLVNAVLHHLGDRGRELPVLPGNEPFRPGLVHRLDRDTSGVMVLAKHAAAMTELAAQFRVHDLERVYLGLVHGVPARLLVGQPFRVETGHGRDPADRRRFAPVEGKDARRAVTVVRIERALGLASLASFRLETGRTHQIRVHARHLGHPILGDELYGHRARDPELADWVKNMGRHALHAAVLGFRHPVRGEPMRFEAPLPGEIRTLLEALLARARVSTSD